MPGSPKTLTASQASEPDRRMPRQIPFIISMEACERFSYYGMLSILAIYMKTGLHMGEARAKEWVHLFSTAVYFLPVLGAWLADRYLGRFLTIWLLSIFYCIGHGILALYENSAGALFWGLAFIALGAGGIKPCVSAFVGDQFPDQDPGQLRTVYGFFYWSINLGAFFAFALIPVVRDHAGYRWAFGIPGIFMLLAAVIFISGGKFYRKVAPRGRQSGSLLQGDVLRQLRKIVLFFLPVPVFWALFNQVNTSWVFQGQQMKPFSVLGFQVDAEIMQSAGALLVLVWVPILTLGVYPWLERRGRKASPEGRIVAGMFLAGVAFVLCGLLQRKLDAGVPLSLAWQWIPYVVLEAGEVLVSASALEWAFQKAPENLKSVVMGLWLLTIAGGHFLVAAMTYLNHQLLRLSGAWEFFGYAVMMLLVCIVLAQITRSRSAL